LTPIRQSGKVREFSRVNKMSWRHILDVNGNIANNGFIPDGTGIPYAVLIGRDGRVAAVGLRDNATLNVEIWAALDKKPSNAP